MENDSVIIRIKILVEQLSNSRYSKPTIFKVDEHLRRVSGKDYEPEILAIGPIHHFKDHVKDMERHKVRYLDQLLRRRNELSIEMFVTELRELEEKAHDCYAKSMLLDRDTFVEMMLLDGCFIIELLRKYYFSYLRDKNDPIFQFDRTLSQIRHDLILFENQLPFFVLNQLFEMTKMEDPDDNMAYLILLFVDDLLPWLDAPKLVPKSGILDADHLLGHVYQSLFPFSTKPFVENDGYKGSNLVHINSTSELKEAGIQFKGSKEVKFDDRILELPIWNVSDKTESLLRNLIAYEQCLPNHHPKFVTDYTYFMHCLVNSTKDIEILRHYGVIRNMLGGDDMVFRMFNGLGRNVLRSSDFCYSGVFDSINKHCSIRRKKWMAKLRRHHFNSPWALVSFIAASVLLLLAFIQTVSSVISAMNS